MRGVCFPGCWASCPPARRGDERSDKRLLARQGGELFYLAEAGPTIAGDEWDTVAMIRFPSIDAFIGLAADPEYLEKAPALREEALERTLWMVTQPPS